MKVQLRPYQLAGVDGIRNAYRQGFKAPLAVFPTGAGKSVILAYVSENSASKGKRVLLVAHRKELVLQLSDKLRDVGLDHGIIAPFAPPQYHLAVQVASVDTLKNRFAVVPTPDLVIFDEAHHVSGKNKWGQVRTAFHTATVLGVTATPCRLDGKGLGDNFDTIVLGPTVAELTAMGFLCPAIYYAPAKKIDLSDIEIRCGDYAVGQLEKRMARPEIIGDAVRHYAKTCSGKPAIAFCTSVENAKQTAHEFRASGFRAVSVDGNTDPRERAQAIAALGNGTLDVLTNCGIVSEGTDVPVVTAAIMLRPTKSLALWLQMVGRCLRPAPGKTHAIILDHASNSLEHGFADEPRAWTLGGKPKRTSATGGPPVTTCPKCFVNHYHARACPACGYVYPVADAREVERVDGELVEVTEAKKQELTAQRKREVSSAKTLEDLRALGAARGYNAKWADHVWQSRKNRR